MGTVSGAAINLLSSCPNLRYIAFRRFHVGALVVIGKVSVAIKQPLLLLLFLVSLSRTLHSLGYTTLQAGRNGTHHLNLWSQAPISKANAARLVRDGHRVERFLIAGDYRTPVRAEETGHIKFRRMDDPGVVAWERR